jgi:ketosteroid isomerase-like protein
MKLLPAAFPAVAAMAALTALTACGAKRIPGTEIRDTPDARAIVDVIDTYRQATERRDAPAVLALVSQSYFDDAGTADPADDVDYVQLKQLLPTHFQKLAAVRLGIGVREVQVKGDRALANVFYDSHYRVATATGEAAKQNSDVSQMHFVREDKAWKIVSGL